MPVQAYTINTRDDMEGNLDGLSYTNSVRESFKAATAIGFGVAVDRDTAGGEDRGVKIGQAAAGHTFGVTIRQLTTESDFRPNTGVANYPAGAVVPVLEEGMIWVKSVAAATVGGDVYVSSTTGAFTSGATAGYVLSNNMKFESSCGAGGLAKVYISKAPIPVAAP